MNQSPRGKLPEASRINGLLNELNQSTRKATQQAVAPSPRPARRSRRKARSVRTLSLGEIFERVNWSNSVEKRQPLYLEPLDLDGKLPRIIGELSLSETMGLINWTNSANPREWPTIGETAVESTAQTASVETVLSTFSWDD